MLSSSSESKSKYKKKKQSYVEEVVLKEKLNFVGECTPEQIRELTEGYNFQKQEAKIEARMNRKFAKVVDYIERYGEY